MKPENSPGAGAVQAAAGSGPQSFQPEERNVARWVGKFQVYQERRFGAGAQAEASQVEAFVEFMARRWGASESEQAEARSALAAWLAGSTRTDGPRRNPMAKRAAAAPLPRPTSRAGARLAETGPPSPAAQGAGEPAPTRIPPAEAGTPSLTLPQALLRLQGVVRLKHYSAKTEEAYSHWVRAYWGFLQSRKGQAGFAQGTTALKVKAFLEHLAAGRRVAAATQNQALNGLAFFYKEVLGQPLGELGEVLRATRPKRLPEVLTMEETQRLLAAMDGPTRLMAQMMYGGGLRLLELIRLRVKDVDLERRQTVVRDGKGGKDRVTMLPGGRRRTLNVQRRTSNVAG